MPNKKKSWLTIKELEYFKDLLIKKKIRIIDDVAKLERETLHNSQRDASGPIRMSVRPERRPFSIFSTLPFKRAVSRSSRSSTPFCR